MQFLVSRPGWEGKRHESVLSREVQLMCKGRKQPQARKNLLSLGAAGVKRELTAAFLD